MRRLSFLLALAVFLLAAGEARAGTLFVTTLSDASVVVHDCATKSYGDCSLRSALTQVNSDPPGDTITFTVSGTITLTSSLPPLSFNGVTINGPGANQLTISGAGRYQVFNGSSSGSLTISGLTITDGSASFGGAVSWNNGGLTISDCVFTGNVASSEGGRSMVEETTSLYPAARFWTIEAAPTVAQSSRTAGRLPTAPSSGTGPRARARAAAPSSWMGSLPS